MAEPQIRFVLTEEARLYLRWLASEILFVKSEGEAAKHLVLKQIESMRRESRHNEPSIDQLRRLFGDSMRSESE